MCVCVCVSSGKYPGEKSLDHVVVLFLSFWGIIILFSKVAVPTCIPTNGASEFPFLHILSNTCMLCYYLCFESHLDICDLVSCCGLDLHLPDTLSIFSCACWSSLCLLWKMSIQILLCVFVLFVFLIMSCISSLYILDIYSLLDILFANIHSQ